FSSTDPLAQLPAPVTLDVADAGTRTFPVAFSTPGMQSITIQVVGTALSVRQADVAVVNLPPQVVPHAHVFLDLPNAFSTTLQSTDPGAEAETVQVDFGAPNDPGGLQTVVSGTTARTVVLSHLYTSDASFPVKVIVTDAFGGVSSTATFLAHVFLPDVVLL